MSSRPLVSIVMATYQRAHLLQRSLEAYETQNFDNKMMEMVIVDDHSTDATREIVLAWSKKTGIQTTILTTAPKTETWRDCGAVLNCGIRASSGDHIILTHPEVIPGRRSVQECVYQLDRFEMRNKGRGIEDLANCPGLYACCRVYYLSPRDQVGLDLIDLKTKGALGVREIEGFYDEDGGAPDYQHRTTDIVAQTGSRLPIWESWVFGGCSRQTWKILGGMLETQKWGSVDVAFMQRRRTLGIPNHTCRDEETIVIHQNHDLHHDIPTPRIEEAWKQELKGVDLTNPNLLCYPVVDFLGWSG